MPLADDLANITALLAGGDPANAMRILIAGAHRYGMKKAADLVRQTAEMYRPAECQEAIALRAVARQIEMLAREVN